MAKDNAPRSFEYGTIHPLHGRTAKADKAALTAVSVRAAMWFFITVDVYVLYLPAQTTAMVESTIQITSPRNGNPADKRGSTVMNPMASKPNA